MTLYEKTPFLSDSYHRQNHSKSGVLLVCYLELIFGIIGSVFATFILPGKVDNGMLWMTVFTFVLLICPLIALYGIYRDALGWIVFYIIVNIFNSTINFIQALKMSVDSEHTDKVFGQWLIFAINCLTLSIIYCYCIDAYGSFADKEDIESRKIQSKIRYTELN